MLRKTVIRTAASAAVLLGALAAGADAHVKETAAYFTDTEFHTNSYTFGEVSVDGTETDWDPAQAAGILPKEAVLKNSRMVNTGDTAAICFMVLDSPVLTSALCADEEGKRTEIKNTEAWKYLQSDGSELFPDQWCLLETDYLDQNKGVIGKGADSFPEGTAFVRRIFGYRDCLSGRNGPTAETLPLFAEVKELNYVEGSFGSDPLPGIDVYFLGVQADYLKLPDGTVTSEASAKNMSDAVLRAVWELTAGQADLSTTEDADTAHHLDLRGNPLAA